MWHIWKTRNEFVFNNLTPNLLSVLILAKTQAMECVQAKLNRSITAPLGASNLSFSGWRPPRSEVTKIHTDAAFDKDTGRGGVQV